MRAVLSYVFLSGFGEGGGVMACRVVGVTRTGAVVGARAKPNNRKEFAPGGPGAGPRCRSAAHAGRYALKEVLGEQCRNN